MPAQLKDKNVLYAMLPFYHVSQRHVHMSTVNEKNGMKNASCPVQSFHQIEDTNTVSPDLRLV